MSLSLVMPWPTRELHPNARIVWQVKQQYVAQARADAHYLALSTINDMRGYKGRMEVIYTFHQPNKAHRDLDNMVANCKAALDGIMDALETNDAQIVRMTAAWGQIIKHGAVTVEVRGV